MYSNEDLERFYFKYQTEALTHGQSRQFFCLNYNVLTISFQNYTKILIVRLLQFRLMVARLKIVRKNLYNQITIEFLTKSIKVGTKKCLLSGVCPKLTAYPCLQETDDVDSRCMFSDTSFLCRLKYNLLESS